MRYIKGGKLESVIGKEIRGWGGGGDWWLILERVVGMKFVFVF